MITYEEALKASLTYFDGDELAAKVFLDKYALRNKEGQLLESTPTDMHHRIARELARVEQKKFKVPLTEQEIFERLDHFKQIVPQGSPMFGVGNTAQIVSLSNCYVVPSPTDSYGGIFRTDEHLIQIGKRRGGVGVDVSSIRPKGCLVNNASKISMGVITFIERFSNSTREIAQDGRRGALMLTLSVHHPEVVEYAKVKQDLKKVTGANISIRFTDEFLEAVKNNTTYEQRFPVDPSRPRQISRQVNAKEVWKQIVECAWQSAEPGILFWDNILKESPADCYADKGFETISTNPCVTGESLVAVADGRNAITIKQLVDEGKDVPVYSYNHITNKVEIQMGRNPRLTREKAEVWKLTLDDNSFIITTPDHNFMLRTGEYKQLKDLAPGDSLMPFNSIVEKKGYVRGHRKIQLNNSLYRHSYRMIYEFTTQSVIPPKYVIHHKDFNPLNDIFSNLQLMFNKDHLDYHSKNMRGDLNPMRDRWYNTLTDVEKREHNKKLSNPGVKNGRYGVPLTEEGKKLVSEKVRKWFADEQNRKYHSKRTLEGRDPEWRENLAQKLTLPRRIITSSCLSCGKPIQIETAITRDIDPRRFCNSSCSNTYLKKGTHKSEDFKRRVTATMKAQRNTEAGRASNRRAAYISKRNQILRLVKYLQENFGEINFQNWEQYEKPLQTTNVIFFSLKTLDKYFPNREELLQTASIFNHKVASVEFYGYEDVYNITVDQNHNLGYITSQTQNSKFGYDFSGIFTKNCAELPLCAGDSCRLMVVNLMCCVDNPYTKSAKFNFNVLHEQAFMTQRLMDDLVDLELEHIDRILTKLANDPEPFEVKARELELWQEIRRKCAFGRRTGTGITALGDAMAAVGIKYGSPESITFVEKVYKELKLGAYRSSVHMAKEIGAFPIWNAFVEKDNPFLKRIEKEDPVLYADMQKYGRRNIALLTTAPTGSVSVLTRTTSGIEPLFMMGYTRRKKVNPNDKNVKINFVDQSGDSWQEFTVCHPPIIEWLQKNSLTDPTKSPWHGACAEDLDWRARVEIQAAAQKHVDHAISSTVNLPENVSVEKVQEIYETAWQKGCKGITVYRKNCRSGVLIESSGEVSTTAPKYTKRPTSLPCDVTHTLIKHRRYFILVGLLDGKPYEVFAGKNSCLSKDITAGTLTKVKRGHYNASFNDGSELKHITQYLTDEEETITRLVSMGLRHANDLSFLVHQLEKVTGDLNSFSKALARALKKYIKDGTKVTGEDCLECVKQGKHGTLVRREGCVTCSSCGSSKC